jgi:rubrerythrin
MKTWICEICGDAYLGAEAPHSCPFCGSRKGFIKPGKEAQPVVEDRTALSEETKGYLTETLRLEVHANAIYTCMANEADTYEVKKMYKRLARVEFEHATICTKLLGIPMPELKPENCNADDVENFKKTIELEVHAADLYAEFAKKSAERHVKIMFTALTQAETDHIALIKNYL